MQLSKIVNTWYFDRLTPNGNEGVGIQLDYLELMYGTMILCHRQGKQ